MRTPSLWSLVRQRTDQIDAFTRRYQLPDDCLGGDARYSLAKDSGRLTPEAKEIGNTSNQPERLDREEVVFAALLGLSHQFQSPRLS